MPDFPKLARIHAASFTTPRPWSATEISGVLGQPGSFLCLESEGFLIGRVIADEAELLTLAVDPDLRRGGLGRKLVMDFLENARLKGAATAFLEVAEDNAPAIGLYESFGFATVGRRKRYYHRPDGQAVDALVMSRPI